jgi:hypothetical protein
MLAPRFIRFSLVAMTLVIIPFSVAADTSPPVLTGIAPNAAIHCGDVVPAAFVTDGGAATLPKFELLNSEFNSIAWGPGGAAMTRSDPGGDAVRFSFTGLTDSSVGIKDNYPVNDIGQIVPSHANGDFTNFDIYALRFTNHNETGSVNVALMLNTGFTGVSGVPSLDPRNDTFWHGEWQTVGAGETITAYLRFDDATPYNITDNVPPHTHADASWPAGVKTSINAWDHAEVSSIGFMVADFNGDSSAVDLDVIPFSGNAVDVADQNPTVTVEEVYADCKLTRTITAADASGNSSSATQVITFTDTDAPVLTIPADATVDCSSIPEPGPVTAVDVCDPAPGITLEESYVVGDCDSGDILTRTWTATDFCGNSVSKTQTITVKDMVPPVLTVPDDVTVACSSIPAVGEATAVDACDDNPVVTYDGEFVHGACPNLHTRTRRWTAVDACGNSVTVSQTITVSANLPPAFVQSSPQTVDMDEDATPTAFSLTLDAADPEGDTITWSIGDAASHGNAAVSGTGTSKSISYTPDDDHNGTDTFSVIISDVYGNSVELDVNVNLASADDPPRVSDITDQTIDEGGSFALISLAAHLTEVDGDAVGWTVSGTTDLTVTIQGSIARVAIPHGDWYGSETVTFTATDQTGTKLAASDDVTLTVRPVNDAPSIDLNGDDGGIGRIVLTADGQPLIDIGSLAIADPDNVTLQSAAVGAVAPLTDGEMLSVDTSQTSLFAVFDQGTGILSVNGVGSLATYAAVLATLQYADSRPPTSVDNRSFDVTVSDGDRSSATATLTVIVDSDDDGAADVWELAFIGDLQSGLADDSDGDGASNADEAAAGTDPGDALSVTGDPPLIVDLELYRSVVQVDGLGAPAWGCRVSVAMSDAAGTISSGEIPGLGALDITNDGHAGELLLHGYASFSELYAAVVPGRYTCSLAQAARSGGIQFHLTVPDFSEADFPDFVTIDNTDAVDDFTLLPTMSFSTSDWEQVAVATEGGGVVVESAGTGESDYILPLELAALSDYTLTVSASRFDQALFRSATTFLFRTGAYLSLELADGWTFFSLPFDQDGQTVADVFTGGQSVWGWNAAGQRFVSLAADQQLEGMRGYWVQHAGGAETKRLQGTARPSGVIPMHRGWNAIGPDRDVALPRDPRLSPAVFGYDGEQYFRLSRGGSNGEQTQLLRQGQAYWIYAYESFDLAPQ